MTQGLNFMIASVWFALAVLTPKAWAKESMNTNPLTASVRLQPSTLAPGQTAELHFKLNVASPYHAYADKFKVAIESPDDLKIADFKVTPLVKFMDIVTKTMRDGLEGDGEGRAVIEVPTGFSTGAHIAKIKLTYQACSKETCLFPKTILLQTPFTVSDANLPAALADSITQPAPLTSQSAAASPLISGSTFDRAISKSLWLAILVVFGMGLITSLTPCIYPMIPITLAVLGARTKGQSRAKSFSLSVTYVLGIALTYSVLGVAAAKTGALFGSLLGNIYVVTAVAALFIAMAISMYGGYEIQPPAFIRNRLGTAKTGAGYGGAFVTGLIAGIVASPCVGPVLVSVLTYIAQTQDLVLGFVLLFSFAMGLGVLFIVLGTSSALLNKMPKAGAWMEATKFIFGTIMIAAALYYVAPIYPAWLFNILTGLAIVSVASTHGAFAPNSALHSNKKRLQKAAMLAALLVGAGFIALGVSAKSGFRSPVTTDLDTKVAHGTAAPKLAWQKYSDDALAAAVAAKKPVLIDFYADWCVACKELEHKTFVDPRIQRLSRDFVLLQIDATEDFPELAPLRARYNVVGLPTMIFYDRSGKVRSDLTVLGFEEADAFVKRMNAALGH